MNLEQVNIIGSGGCFPIELTTPVDNNGTPEMVETTEGVKPKVGWYPIKGDIKLIEQNLRSILLFQIGQRFRQENFGTRIWECIEEPNDQLLEFLVKDFIRDGINSWEPRIKSLAVDTRREYDKVLITVRFQVNFSNTVSELNFEYNHQNRTLNVNQ